MVPRKTIWYTSAAVIDGSRCAEGVATEADAYTQEHPKAKSSVFILQGSRGKRQRRSASKVFALENFAPHDLRRTAATMMASTGTPRPGHRRSSTMPSRE